MQKTACIFVFVDLASGEDNLKYRRIIDESLNLEFEKMDFKIIKTEVWEGAMQARKLFHEDLIFGPNALSLAGTLSADIAVTAFCFSEENWLTLEIKCYDVKNRRLITGSLESGRAGLSVYNLITKIMQSASAIVEKYSFEAGSITFTPEITEPSETDKAKEIAILPAITLYSRDEDAEIFLAGEKRAGKITQGLLVLSGLSLLDGTELVIVMKKEGYHDCEQRIKLKEGKTDYKLKSMSPKHKFGTGITWTTGQLMGFGVFFRYYFLPDYMYLSGDNYFYIQYNVGSNSNAVIHDDLRILLGGYLFGKPHSRIRLGLATGLGAVFSFYTIPETAPHTDFYFNLLNVSFELNFPQYSIYLDAGFRYFLGWGNDAIGRRWGWVGHKYPSLTLGVIKKW